MKKIMITTILLVLLSGCNLNENLKTEQSDALKFKEEYEKLNDDKSNQKEYRKLEIDENNPFYYKTADDIIEMMENNKTFVVYFGFASCPWCRSIIPSLIEVATDLNITTIYYVDVKEIRDTLELDEQGNAVTKKDGTEGYYKLLEKLEPVLESYTLTDQNGNEVDTGKKRIYAPNIVSVIDGVATEMTDGISDSQTDAYMDLTEIMKQESYDKIKCSIECVVNNQKVCAAKTKC